MLHLDGSLGAVADSGSVQSGTYNIGFTFEFFLVKDAQLNAFALPGGMIGVHTGLMVAAQSESELASVLAHEIGHVTQRHIARMLSQQRQTSVLAMAGHRSHLYQSNNRLAAHLADRIRQRRD